jgi:hypothetical protein
MKPEELDRYIRESAGEYNAPPEPPREEMWAAIRESLPSGDDRADVVDLAAHRERRDRRHRLAPWAAGFAAAAILAIGFGLGRATRDQIPGPAAVARTDADTAGISLPVRLATATHMGEAEALLTLFRASDRADDRAATARWARDLLSTTRVLLDSRVAEDPEVAALLADLELVLVQIASTAAADSTEQELIEEGIEQRQLLAKLRSAAETPTEMAM